MTLQDLIPLLPLLVLAAFCVIILLAIAIRRNHSLTYALTLLGLAGGLGVLPLAASGLPHSVTPLIVVDRLAIFYMALVMAASLVIVILSPAYMEKVKGNKEEYYLLIMLATLGSVVLITSNHFVSFFLGLETLSISLYSLIAYTRLERQRVESAIKYLVIAAAATSFLLFGMALIYLDLGSMQFNQMLSQTSLSAGASGLLTIGLALIMVGIGFKLALVPFHMWAPDVYQGAPAPVTAFVATVSKASVFALLLRLSIHLPITVGSHLWSVLALIAILSMLVGNLLAIVQNNIKRVLAYSSIAHFGYILVPFLANNSLSITSITFYLVVYIATTLIAFGVITQLSDPAKELDDLEDYRGLFRLQSPPAIFLTLAMLSLAGLPPTGGLVGKIFLAASGVESAEWLLLAALVLGSIIGVFYYMRIVIILFRSPDEASPKRTVPIIKPAAGILFTVLSLGLLLLGIFPTPVFNLIGRIVAGLG